MSGHVGDLTPAQEEALRKVMLSGDGRIYTRVYPKLKASLSDVTLPESDDYYFLRWLRGKPAS